MKKYIICSLLLAAATIANAVPARRGWRTVTQPDGTTIEVQKMGDEYYHYLINREGQELRLKWSERLLKQDKYRCGVPKHRPTVPAGQRRILVKLPTWHRKALSFSLTSTIKK